MAEPEKVVEWNSADQHVYVVPLVMAVVPSESVATCFAVPEVVTVSHPAALEAGHWEPWGVQAILSVVPEFAVVGAVPVTEIWFFTVPGEAVTVGLLSAGVGFGVDVYVGVGGGVDGGFGVGFGVAGGIGTCTDSPEDSHPSKGVPSGASADAVVALVT